MKKLTIGKRIALGTGFLCLIIVAISLFAITRLNSLNEVTCSIVGDSLPGVIYAAQINLLHNENQIRCRQLLTAKTAKDRELIKAEMAAGSKLSAEALKAYEGTITAEDDRQNFAKVNQARDAYRTLREKFFLIVETNQMAAGEFIEAEVMPAYKAYSAAATVLQDYNEKLGQERGAMLAKQVAGDVRILQGVGLLALIGGIAGSVLIVISISQALRGIAGHLSDGANQLSAAANQVSATSQSLAEGASEQAASLEETSASLEEIASMTQRNAQNVQSAKDYTAQTRATAESGAQSTHEMGQAMHGIRAASGEMRDAMNGIKAASNDVSKIIKTIDEIAFQTNILALNAAVEAARAGEAGMGFAVVADEVRNLAQRSAKAAKETTDMIETSIKRSEDGVRVTDKVVASVAEVATKSQLLEAKLAEIVAKAQKVDEQVAQVASASQEQSQGISEVNMAVTQMDKVTQGNASNAEESAAAAEELNAQAAVLTEIVTELQTLVGGSNRRGAAGARAQAAAPADLPAPTQAPPRRSKPALAKNPPTATTRPASADRDFPMPEPIGAGSAASGFKDF
jgi:methyl-accepting chemotaxis protein